MTVPASVTAYNTQSGASFDAISRVAYGDGPVSETEVYLEMMKFWSITHDLWGGTEAMQRAGKTYLPQEDAETPKAYRVRLALSVLFGGYKKAIRDLVGKPFGKPITFTAPKWADQIIERCDTQGRHINVAWREWNMWALRDGIAYILVDYPRAVNVNTLADEQARKLAPYFCYIDPRNIIGWRTEQIDGKEVLSQVRIRETVTEPLGDWDEKFVKQVRVYSLEAAAPKQGQSAGVGKQVRWQVWREVVGDDNGKSFDGAQGYQKGQKPTWYLVSTGVLSGAAGKVIDRIPLVPIYTGQEGFMIAKPPLMDVAYLNLAHWRSDSDQRNTLHHARIPILAAYGWPQEDTSKKGKKVEFASGTLIKMPNFQSKIEWVEHKGTALEAGSKDLEQLESRMARLGARMLEKQATGKMTATENIMDAQGENSELSSMMVGSEDSLELCFDFASKFIPDAKEDEVEVEINKDFDISLQEQDELDVLVTLESNRKITHETLLNEMQRRNVLSDSIDVKTEISKLEAQGPSLNDILSVAGAGGKFGPDGEPQVPPAIPNGAPAK